MSLVARNISLHRAAMAYEAVAPADNERAENVHSDVKCDPVRIRECVTEAQAWSGEDTCTDALHALYNAEDDGLLNVLSHGGSVQDFTPGQSDTFARLLRLARSLHEAVEREIDVECEREIARQDRQADDIATDRAA